MIRGINLVKAITCILFFIGVLAAHSSLANTYDEGRSAYIGGDYQRAYDILMPLAELGDPEAQKIIGIMFDYGQGVENDPQQALYWYTRSAEQGISAVQYQVGAKYFRGDGTEKNFDEAAIWWKQAAIGGQVDAQFNLGLMYSRGLSVEKDHLKAARLFKLAADQGHSYAQYSLAVMYSFGQGIEKDLQKAFSWFSKSSEQGVAQAQFNMGVYYENGYAVEKDLDKAIIWYELASAQDLDEATEKLKNIASLGTDMENAQETISYESFEIPAGNIKREDWVLSQQPDTYTLQIGSVVKEESIVDFIKKNKLESDAAYIEVVVSGVTRYNAFYGVYDDFKSANNSLAGLPAELQKAKPWIRNFKVLHRILNE